MTEQILLANPSPEKVLSATIPVFNWKVPEYSTIYRQRVQALTRIRKDPESLPLLKAYYRDHPAQFIVDWGCTVDPRNVERGLPSIIPFVLFEKQVEWVDWVLGHWRAQTPGLTEKTRDMGMSWLAIGLSCTLCLFYEGMGIGFGSRKEEYVDKIDAPKSLFHKGRTFLSMLPEEFRGGWRADHDAPHMRINFPESGSNISGEAGDNIGRGDRTGIYFVDESAHIEHPQLIDASLAQTTNCRIDISSANGNANSFAQKRFSGKIDVFTFHWRDDPRKDDTWYQKQQDELDPVTIAQEIDINYAASVEGSLIPPEWAQAAVDAHIKLNIKATGARSASLDVADEGKDLNALCGSHGVVIDQLHERSGKGADIFDTVEWAFGLCDVNLYKLLRYDADGLGAGVRGDARIINERRYNATKRKDSILQVEAFRGSGAVLNPTGEDVKGRLNEDYFGNRKAQAWWALRARFQKTFRAVVEGHPFNPDEIISISSTACGKLYRKLITELSQVTYAINGIGKIIVDKTPDGARSPNLADGVMIQFSQAIRAPMKINPAVFKRA